jgi:hypothetical protein
MADYDSALPIRSEADGSDERVHVKICDGTTPTQMATVDSDGNVYVQAHGKRADDAADVTLRLSELGNANTDGVYEADNNSLPSNTGLIACDRAAAPAATDQTLRLTGVQGTTDTTHWSLDVAMHDGDGEGIDDSHPLPIKVVSGLSTGTPVFAYEKESAVAKDGTGTHTITPSADTEAKISQISASGSGKIKMEVKWGPTASEVLKYVAFNSTAQPNICWTLMEDLVLAETDSLIVTVTNLDNAAQDIYTTIEYETRAV